MIVGLKVFLVLASYTFVLTFGLEGGGGGALEGLVNLGGLLASSELELWESVFKRRCSGTAGGI